MKRKALFLLAIASVVMLALPTKAWADGMNEAQKESPIKKKNKGSHSKVAPLFHAYPTLTVTARRGTGLSSSPVLG